MSTEITKETTVARKRTRLSLKGQPDGADKRAALNALALSALRGALKKLSRSKKGSGQDVPAGASPAMRPIAGVAAAVPEQLSAPQNRLEVAKNAQQVQAQSSTYAASLGAQGASGRDADLYARYKAATNVTEAELADETFLSFLKSPRETSGSSLQDAVDDARWAIVDFVRSGVDIDLEESEGNTAGSATATATNWLDKNWSKGLLDDGSPNGASKMTLGKFFNELNASNTRYQDGIVTCGAFQYTVQKQSDGTYTIKQRIAAPGQSASEGWMDVLSKGADSDVVRMGRSYGWYKRSMTRSSSDNSSAGSGLWGRLKLFDQFSVHAGAARRNSEGSNGNQRTFRARTIYSGPAAATAAGFMEYVKNFKGVVDSNAALEWRVGSLKKEQGSTSAPGKFTEGTVNFSLDYIPSLEVIEAIEKAVAGDTQQLKDIEEKLADDGLQFAIYRYEITWLRQFAQEARKRLGEVEEDVQQAADLIRKQASESNMIQANEIKR